MSGGDEWSEKMRFFPALILLCLAACDSRPGSGDPSSQAGPVPPPPPQLCAQAGKALEQFEEKAAIVYDDRGRATVPQEIWMAMGSQHSQFAQALALHAACTHPDGAAERPVLIRNETGVVLMEATVSTNIGLGSLPEE
jgi:hypothetical protein